MSTPNVRPVLDPLAHKSAIDALEAQRAAYRRYARTVEAQRAAVGDGDGDRAMAAVDRAASDFVELTEGARRLEPLVRQVHETGSLDQVRDMERQMERLMREARQAEAAIQNMTTQLEAWRDAYGRQLAEVGVVPGGAGSGASDAREAGGVPRPPARGGPYGAPAGDPPGAPGRATLIDRRG